jgi:poly(hydroxyalkanoate) granule-associated protein
MTEETSTPPVPETSETPAQKAGNGSKNPVAAGVESALRASIGLFSLGKEEAEAIVNRMIERGELAEKDGRRIIRDLFDRPKKGVQQINRKMENALDETIVGILNMLNVPTRSDLQTLSEKINELAEKVDALSKKVS